MPRETWCRYHPTKPPEVLGDEVDLPDLWEELPKTDNADRKSDDVIPRLVTKEEIRRSWENYRGPPSKKVEVTESSAPAEQPEAPAKAEAEKSAPTKVEAEKTKAKPKYTAGQLVGDQVLDPERIPNGYKCEDGANYETES